MKKALSDMAIGELEELLKKLKEHLDEAEEERMYVLRQTGFYVPGGTIGLIDRRPFIQHT